MLVLFSPKMLVSITFRSDNYVSIYNVQFSETKEWSALRGKWAFLQLDLNENSSGAIGFREVLRL